MFTSNLEIIFSSSSNDYHLLNKFTFFAGKYCLAEPLSSTSKSPKNSNSCFNVSKPAILDRIGNILEKKKKEI